MFNFLASKYRQPPEYSPQEEDEEEQFKSARSVFKFALTLISQFLSFLWSIIILSFALQTGRRLRCASGCEVQTLEENIQRLCRRVQVQNSVAS